MGCIEAESGMSRRLTPSVVADGTASVRSTE